MSSNTIEICGQCSKCKDFFTVELLPVRRSAEKRGMKYFRPLLSSRLIYKKHTIYHHPTVCNGEVKLFGSLRYATFPTYTKNTNRTTSKTTHGSNKQPEYGTAA